MISSKKEAEIRKEIYRLVKLIELSDEQYMARAEKEGKQALRQFSLLEKLINLSDEQYIARAEKEGKQALRQFRFLKKKAELIYKVKSLLGIGVDTRIERVARNLERFIVSERYPLGISVDTKPLREDSV